jgi:hypothetical protein
MLIHGTSFSEDVSGFNLEPLGCSPAAPVFDGLRLCRQPLLNGLSGPTVQTANFDCLWESALLCKASDMLW